MNYKEIYNLTLLTVITTIVWLFVGIYEAFFLKESQLVDPALIKEIKVERFDEEVLNQLTKKTNYYK